MKKLFFILSFLICAIISFGQYPINQSLGGDSTLVTSKGGFKGRIINFQFDDTTQANTQRISQYPASQIVTKAGQFYIRDSSATKWILLGSGFSPFPTCGLMDGTGQVSYDSTLDFDVSAATYALCCDGIPRQSDFTVVHLQGDADNPRYVAIILDANGVDTVNGVPAADPALPQLTTCQIALTYVLINAGDNVPANVSVNTPYDEGTAFSGNEWDTSSTSSSVFNFRDTQHPAHLTHDLKINAWTTGLNQITLTSPSTIQLTNYSVLKFYLKLNSTVSSTQPFLTLKFKLDGSNVTQSVSLFSGYYGFSYSNLNYQIITIPIIDFGISNPNANKLQITLNGANSFGCYIDWIQLQSGISPPPPSVPSVQSIAATGNDIIAPNVINPTGANTTIQLPFASIIPHGVLYNPQNTSAQPVVDTFDVSVVKGYLPITNLPAIPAGYYIGSNDGITNVLLPITFPAPDTIAAVLPLRVSLSGDPSIPDTLYLNYGNGLQLVNDSLYLGGSLAQETSIEMFNNSFSLDSAGNHYFVVDPSNSYIQFQNPLGSTYLDVDWGGKNIDMVAGENLTRITLADLTETVKLYGINGVYINYPALILDTQYTPPNSIDNTYPIRSIVADDTNLYYRKSNGTWVKIPWQVF